MSLWTLVAAPLLGSLLLALSGRRLQERGVAAVACTAVGLSAVGALLGTIALVRGSGGGMLPGPVAPGPGGAPRIAETLHVWFGLGPVEATMGLLLDPLAAVMALVVTGVGLLIHVYAAAYMSGDEGFSRFFAYMNLFVAAMLILILADGLVLLYLGWEGVGLCSYLLIGFRYRDPDNVRAADKAFIVTRIGDVAFAVGLFVIAWELGSLDIGTVLDRAPQAWAGSATATLVAGLLLVGAAAKSAQVPLQVWLPDAMAGPTPVSALLHAATMVTAGVYLIARTHTLFLLAPDVLGAVAAVGTLTALLAAASALAQTDAKRVLAYSTISQIGFMFAALGVGAFATALFHFVTHAFFKALLFLTAGMVTHACGETDITRMGSLARKLPVTAALGLVGAASLAGIPLVTAGFYSKEAILTAAFAGPRVAGIPWVWAALSVAAALTAVYAFRWWLLIFVARGRGPATEHAPGPGMTLPAGLLAAGAVLAGLLETPGALGGIHVLPDFLAPVFEAGGSPPRGGHGGSALILLAAVVSLAGAWLAHHVWVGEARWARRLSDGALGRAVSRLWRRGWRFDALYAATIVRPFRALVTGLRGEPVGLLVDAGVAVARGAHGALSRTQSGRLRTYATALIAGVFLLLLLWWSP